MMQKKQRGMTMISWVIVITLVAIQGVAAMRIVPVYLNYSSVKQIMEEVKADSASHGATPAQLTIMFNKRLNINGIYDLQKEQEAFSYEKTSQGMNVILHYEVRRPIYGNLEFIATFDHEIEIPGKK
ncbi:MAG: DUF4845 domain-containing protein [Gammaproteobacteria bacterium]|nr:DUF4845 domain-containing protein [Gammaproteobacteria bacterium]